MTHEGLSVLLKVTLTVSTFDTAASERRSLNLLQISDEFAVNAGPPWSGITVAQWPMAATNRS